MHHMFLYSYSFCKTSSDRHKTPSCPVLCGSSISSFGLLVVLAFDVDSKHSKQLQLQVWPCWYISLKLPTKWA